MIRVYVLRDRSRATYRLAYRNPLTGKWGAKQSTVPIEGSRGEAEREAGDWQKELNSARGVARDVTWEHFRTRAENELFPRVRKSTARAYAVALNAVERYLGTPKKLRLLDGAELSRFLGKRRQELNMHSR